MAALNIPIQMFGACSTLGDMTPLWFRYENKDHGIITVKIESIVSSREEKFCGMEHISFVCWAVAEGQRRLIELRYRISTLGGEESKSSFQSEFRPLNIPRNLCPV